MARRKEYRAMVFRLKDAIDAILMYSELVPPTKDRIFRMDPAMFDWLKEHAEAARVLLDWRAALKAQKELAQGATNVQANGDAGGDVP